jgi:hypothetical protein
MSRDHLSELTEWFVRVANGNLSDQIVAAYLRGSAARGDNIPGISDVDFYMIVHDSALLNTSSRQTLYDRLHPMVQEANRRWAAEKPMFRVVPMSYLRLNKVGSFLTSLEAKILVGSDVLAQVEKPTAAELSQFGCEELRRFSDFWTQRDSGAITFNSLSEMASYKQYVTLKLAQTALLSKGIISLRKQEVSEAFGKEFYVLDSADVVDRAKSLRENGLQSSTDSELRCFIDEADRFLGILREDRPSKT